MTRHLVILLTCSAALWAQTWSGSGSNGSDGALSLGNDTPGAVAGILVFDPIALNLDADADNIYHFTTITIRDGLGVRFLANRMRRPGPVVFLATGVVAINGYLDFSGEDGHPATNNDSLRRISIPGPGGYPGGVGGRSNGAPPTLGLGPAGGKVPASNAGPTGAGCSGGYTTVPVAPWCVSLGVPSSYGTNLLQPLVGGSGGSGAWPSDGLGGGGGGAGGGAFRLSSSVAIVFGTGLAANNTAVSCNPNPQRIYANGGADGYQARPGSGAGGGIHLQAPIVAGCGIHIYANGRTVYTLNAGQYPNFSSEGRVRIDANSVVSVVASPLATSNALVDAPAPANQPFLRITSVNGVVVPASPRFDYASPDVLINSTNPVPLVLAASNIPVNTPVTVFITTDTGADITTTVNLAGTLASSTATANITLPLGTARLLARAVW